ncbi:MAG: hypothetical protein SAMD01599839_07800 [Rectinema sp.]
MSQARPEVLMKLWLMEHFRILPTDPRINAVSEEQTSILFNYWVQYDEDLIRRAWRERASRPKFSLEELHDLGYSDEEAEGIKRAFEA